ncbi:hypothetical protein Ciccas_014515, partial [Cichlidogyrus casuarinus]
MEKERLATNQHALVRRENRNPEPSNGSNTAFDEHNRMVHRSDVTPMTNKAESSEDESETENDEGCPIAIRRAK